MAFSVADVIESIRHSRAHFLKHVAGLTDEQWTWQPYPECKSAADTVAHLIADDRAALDSLQSGQEPDYEAAQTSERDPKALMAQLAESHEALMQYLEEHYAAADLDTPVSIWGNPSKAGLLGYLSSEDFYHAGQISFIRMATEPAWNYYEIIYA